MLDSSGRHLQGSETGVDLLMPGPDGCRIASGSRTKVHKIASYNQILESENMTLQLPDVVQAYFAVTNGGDAAQLASCFRSDATVSDERKTYEGTTAIEAWQQEARRAFIYQVQPLHALQGQGRLTVIAHLVGNFPGSPVQLSHVFTLEGGRIRSLEITPC
jgi:hypothetical protein